MKIKPLEKLTRSVNLIDNRRILMAIIKQEKKEKKEQNVFMYDNLIKYLVFPLSHEIN